MNLETELRELAQTHLDLIQDIQWHDLRRAVVIHLESMEEHDTLIIPRIPTLDKFVTTSSTKSPVQNGQMEQPAGQHGTPSFFKYSRTVNPSGCGCHAKPYVAPTSDPRGIRHQQGQLSCTDPNCLRAHAPNWLYAELWAFRWWVQHEFNTGLATGYTLNGDLIGMSTRTANLTLATMPYVDEAYYHKFRWHAPIPQPETYGDMIVTAPSRRANLNNEQPRKTRTSTPRRHNTPKRTVTPPRPVVIWVDAPPAPAPATPTHPWLTPEPNWEEDPWTRAEREHAEQQEARAKAKAPPPPAPYSGTRCHQPLHQWHPPSTHPANTGLNKLRSTEPLRLSARLPVLQSIAVLPVSPHHHRPQAQQNLHRLLHKQTSTPWHSHGIWSVVSRLHLLRQESQTPFWEHGLKDHRSNLPARCHRPICRACRPSYEKTAAFNWTVSSSPSSHPCFSTTTQSALAHGARSYRATWHHRPQAINILIAFSLYPWHPKHKQQTPPCSSFGGTNISCLPGTWHKNASPTVVRGPQLYQTICRPFSWRPSTSWNWPAQWDHHLNCANQKAQPWPPWPRLCLTPSKAQWRWTWRWASQRDTLVNWSWKVTTGTAVWSSIEPSTSLDLRTRDQRALHSPLMTTASTYESRAPFLVSPQYHIWSNINSFQL